MPSISHFLKNNRRRIQYIYLQSFLLQEQAASPMFGDHPSSQTLDALKRFEYVVNVSIVYCSYVAISVANTFKVRPVITESFQASFTKETLLTHTLTICLKSQRLDTIILKLTKCVGSKNGYKYHAHCKQDRPDKEHMFPRIEGKNYMNLF